MLQENIQKYISWKINIRSFYQRIRKNARVSKHNEIWNFGKYLKHRNREQKICRPEKQEVIEFEKFMTMQLLTNKGCALRLQTKSESTSVFINRTILHKRAWNLTAKRVHEPKYTKDRAENDLVGIRETDCGRKYRVRLECNSALRKRSMTKKLAEPVKSK